MAKIMPNMGQMVDEDPNVVTDPNEAILGTKITQVKGDRPVVRTYARNKMTVKRPDGTERQVDGRLTRGAMVQAVREGRSVRIPTTDDALNAMGGQLITNEQDIPSEGELAILFNEPGTVEDVQKANEAKIKQLQDENDRLASTAKKQQQAQAQTQQAAKGKNNQ